jgi:hypothetical protein
MQMVGKNGRGRWRLPHPHYYAEVELMSGYVIHVSNGKDVEAEADGRFLGHYRRLL